VQDARQFVGFLSRERRVAIRNGIDAEAGVVGEVETWLGVVDVGEAVVERWCE
jgi:hypothetical protein